MAAWFGAEEEEEEEEEQEEDEFQQPRWLRDMRPRLRAHDFERGGFDNLSGYAACDNMIVIEVSEVTPFRKPLWVRARRQQEDSDNG